MDIHLGVEGSNFNGHGEELDKEGNMMQIIEKLQKDAQTHRVDIRNLRKAQEKQGEFNVKLLKSLERIENKLEKESDSSKTWSRRTPEKKRRSRSARRHRRCSPKHSNKETHISSSHQIWRRYMMVILEAFRSSTIGRSWVR